MADFTGGVSLVQFQKVPTYRCGLTGQTFYSTAAAVLVEIVGSATKIVKVRRILIWGQAGTKFYTELTLLRASTVSGTGTANVPVIGKHQSDDPTATAVVNNYTAAATSGTGAAIVGAAPLPLAPPAAGVQIFPTLWEFAQNDEIKPFVLKGTSEVLQVYNNILTLGTATYGFEIEWEEDVIE